MILNQTIADNVTDGLTSTSYSYTLPSSLVNGQYYFRIVDSTQAFSLNQLTKLADTASSNASSKGTSAGAIAGIVIGGLVVLAALCVLALFCLRRRRRRSTDSEPNEPNRGTELFTNANTAELMGVPKNHATSPGQGLEEKSKILVQE